MLQRRRTRWLAPVLVAPREMPLAVPARRVAVLPEHRAPGGERGIEGAAAGDQRARLVRVEAREQRGARGRAVVGGGVVAREGDPFPAQALDVGGQAEAPGGRREPLGEAK